MITTQTRPGGEVTILIPSLPPSLPLVTKRDLEQAWEAATSAKHLATPHIFNFAGAVELAVTDRDATAWVAAVQSTIGLTTPRGISICLRLLALIALMAQAGWVRSWFTLGPTGAAIRPELLHAAALLPLNPNGGFDETALQALLPPQ